MSCESNERIELGAYTKYKGMTMSKNYYNSLMEFKKDKNIDFDSMIVEIKKNYIEPRKQRSSTKDCNQIDKSGRYMDIALNEVRTTGNGFLITGSQFIGDTYLVQGYSPEYGVSIDVAMKINVCGEIVDVDL